MSAILGYATSNARLDARRIVLQCRGCGEPAPWIDATAATLAGWTEEDRTVGGQRVRFWRCPACKLEPPAPSAPSAQAQLVELGHAGDPRRVVVAPFGGRRTILVRLGQSAGTQFAAVLEELPEGLRVTGWRVSSRKWTKPKLVPPEKIFAPRARGDKRWRKALECWPPHWMRDEPRCQTPE